jgi:peptidoglycan/LPS O-acetylase OafA/YrhL
MYFLAGATYFLFIENIVISKKFFLFALGLTILSIQNNFYLLIAPLTLPYILFWLAFKLPFTNFDKYGDFSYGLYIYAFPIQQMLSFFGLNTKGFNIYFILSLLMSMIPSVLSYHIIEKPFLKLKTIQIKQIRLLFKR